MRLVHPRRGGFTLVEIMIVVAIIGLLSAMAIPSFARARDSSREKTCVNNLRQIDGAKDQYALENGLSTGDPAPAMVAGELMDYLRREEPVCPVGNTPYIVGAIGGGNVRCNSSAAAVHNAAYY